MIPRWKQQVATDVTHRNPPMGNSPSERKRDSSWRNRSRKRVPFPAASELYREARSRVKRSALGGVESSPGESPAVAAVDPEVESASVHALRSVTNDCSRLSCRLFEAVGQLEAIDEIVSSCVDGQHWVENQN